MRKPQLIKFFVHHFMWHIVKVRLHFFLYLIERYKWHSVFPRLHFVNQTLFSHSILFAITCTSITGGIMVNRRQL